MSYNVHNFRTGETIEAPPINEMDEQISTNEENITLLAAKTDAVDLDVGNLKSSITEESDNLCVLSDSVTYPFTKSGVTISQDDDGTIVLNGTATATTQFLLGKGTTGRLNTWLPAGFYSFGLEINEDISGSTKFQIRTVIDDTAVIIVDTSLTNRVAENYDLSGSAHACYIQIAKNLVYNNFRARVMINAGNYLKPYQPGGLTAIDKIAREMAKPVSVLIKDVEVINENILSAPTPVNMTAVSGKENVTGGIAGGTNTDYVYTGRGVEWASGSTAGITVMQINAPCIISLINSTYEITINQYSVHLGQHKSGQWVKNWTDGVYKSGPVSVQIVADSYPAYFAIGLHSATGADISGLIDTIFANNVTIQYIRAYDGHKKPEFISLSMFKRIAVTGCSWPAGRGYRWESWAGNLARRNSVVVMDYAIGGTNIVNWYNNKANTPESIGAGMKNMIADDACHLYVLNFGGVNDRNEFNNGTHQVGTIADCQADEKPLTYYGYFGRIIEMIHAHAPYAAIIISSPDCTPSYNAVGTSEKNFAEINEEIANYYNEIGYRVVYMDITKDPYYHTYVTDLLQQHPTVVTHSGASMMYERCISQTVAENESVFVVSPAHFDEMDTVPVAWEQLEDTSQTDEEPDLTAALPIKCTPYDELEARVATKANPVFTGSVSMGRKANTASGYYSTALGWNNEASGAYSSAIGYGNKASGHASRAEGAWTSAIGRYQKAFGKFNKEDTIFPTWAANTHYYVGDKVIRIEHTDFGDLEWKLRCITENTDSSFVSSHWEQIDQELDCNYMEIAGNGSSDNSRSNARTLDWDGNESLAGSITLGKGTTDEVTLTAAQLKQLLALLT